MLTHALPISARRRGRAFRRFANREPVPREPVPCEPVPCEPVPCEPVPCALGIPAAVLRRGRLIALGVGGFLLPWCVVLGATLPATATVQNWSLAWVGLDAAEAATALATAALLARADVRAGVTAAAGGTLLLADAWFDVCTSAPGLDHSVAVAEAIFVELPLAAAAFWLAARLNRATQQTARAHRTTR